MARKTIGSWFHGLGGKKADAGAQIGNQVITNEGTVLGTITVMWKGADATDHATHEDTLGVRQSEHPEESLLYIPSGAIARVSDQGVVLTVDSGQVAARGWRFRPGWLAQDAPLDGATGTQAWKTPE